MGVVTDETTGQQYSASSMYPEDYTANPGFFDNVDITSSAQRAISEGSNTLLWLVESGQGGERILMTESEFKYRF